MENFSEIIKINEHELKDEVEPIVNEEFIKAGLNLNSENIISSGQVVELKNDIFEIIEHLIENDPDGLIRKKIVRILDFHVLLKSVNRIYNGFIE